MNRRQFIGAASIPFVSSSMGHSLFGASKSTVSVPIGLDAHALRGMKWKAPQLIEFAAKHKLDAVLVNGFKYLESLEDSYLKEIKRSADDSNLAIYFTAGGISEKATSFSNRYGSAADLLSKGIDIASILGSPVVNVRIGSIKDRYTEGGIEARMEESIAVLKAARNKALDSGIKIGFENHAADLRAEEVLTIIHEVGHDVCGAMLDPGNSLWSLEDPMQHLQKLGPYAVCTSIRDYMVWESDEGANFQWTAIGEGMMDAPTYVRNMAKLCPGVPLFVETISNSKRSIPFLQDDFWQGYPNLKAEGMVDFLKLCRKGHPIEVVKPPAGTDQKEFDRNHQQEEFLKSIKYLRENCMVTSASS